MILSFSADSYSIGILFKRSKVLLSTSFFIFIIFHVISREMLDTLHGEMIELTLDPQVNRTGDIWHICVEVGYASVPAASLSYH